MELKELLYKVELRGNKIYAFLEKIAGILICLLIGGLFYMLQSSLNRDEISLKENGIKGVATVFRTRYYKGDRISLYYVVNKKGYRSTAVINISKFNFPDGFGIGYQYEVRYLPSNPKVRQFNFRKRIYPKTEEEKNYIIRLVDSLNGRQKIHIKIDSKLPDFQHAYDSIMNTKVNPIKER